uniref:GRIP domain-containing protein n=1 Tax=Elaeophora elaphi TaxID=1147741 RepID=A0A0R3RXE1_9BILA
MVDCLQNELNDKNEYIKNLAKQCSDAEWSLGEHRQWLQDVNNRVQGLENELCSRNGHVEELRQEIGNRNADISNCHVTIDALNSELSEKNLCIANAEKAKNDAEWSLGEHRQWLQNANNSTKKRSVDNEKFFSALESTIEDIRREINNKNAYINDLEKQRNDLEWSLGEHRQWLQNANERIADLENYDKGKDELIRELHNEMDELSKKAVLDLKAALEAVKNEAQLKKSEQVPIEQLMAKLHNSEQALAEQPKLDDLICLRNENENLKKVLKDKSECIDGLTQQKNDLEWSLGEHRQWLQDCNDRANWLDSIVVAKNGEIDALRCENDRLKTDLAKISQNGDINELTATIENLRNEINNKNNDINEMMKQRNEAEWKLGEHRQWLADANNRADDLAGKLIEKQHALSLLLEKHPESVEEEHNKISATSLGSEPTEIDKSTELNFYLSSILSEYEMALAKLREELNEKDADLVRVNKDRSDAEWFLGEERQRLSDANQRISHLEEELACLKVKHAEVLNNLRNETCELNEKLLCEKYMQLISLLGTVQEHLAKRQIEASEFVNSKELWKVIENLNNELHQRKAENENLLQKKNDAEWQLDEHREWLRNANNRNAQLKEDVKHLQDEVRNLLTSVTDRTEEVEKNSCQECKEVSALNRVENFLLSYLSSISPLLENLRKELNYQKIIDTLMEQHSKTEQLLEERRESITNAYNKFV